MAIDERLLNLPVKKQENEETDESSSDAYDIAGDLRAAKRQEYLEEEPATLREAVISAKRKQSQKVETETASSINPIGNLTASLLRAAWANLISSFGLTLLYIDFHWFMNQVLGDSVFPPLGAEWNIVKVGMVRK